jgi:uncharacterized protein with von Willebrand factor type A (vWA) domain
MRSYYGEYDGSEFPTPEKLFAFDQFMQFILQHGDAALRAMSRLLNDPEEPGSDLLEKLLEEGMIEKDGAGKLRLTPRAVTRMQSKALNEVFSNLREGRRDGHEVRSPGGTAERSDGSRPYEYGDPISELDLHATLRNAMGRAIEEARARANVAPGALREPGADPAKARFRIAERDFELFQLESRASCSTVVLLDMSGSMMRYGRFTSAKRVALAMQALVRGRFPQDTLDFVGFYSGARRVPEITVPLLTPKPVSIYDSRVRLKVPLDQLDSAPQHFTNLHMGLQLARRILRRRGGENRQIFIITDGQPTAHVEGDFCYLLYPPDRRSTLATLKEAHMAAREGCRFATFALIEDYWGMDWVGFVDQLTRLTRGMAFYTTGAELGGCVMESFLSGKRKKSFLG